ncbi:MAG: hypothetical protein IJB95_02010 [Clostridia bacterium]|nr:hypothetical protein [Clostridia bacterium]
MKKILVIALAVVMMVYALALVACGPQEKVAYGIVHKSYVGKGTVVVAGGKISSASIDEACLPTYVVASEASDDTVTATVFDHGNEVQKHFYKTVKFADITLEYDLTDGYKSGSTKLMDLLKEEANCEKWFEAVASDSVSVMIAGKEDKTIMTSAKLLKSKNGYWGTPAENALGWKANVEATCAYVVANGFAAESFEQVAGEGKLDNEKVDNLGVHTGATWTDMLDYYNVLKAAFNK